MLYLLIAFIAGVLTLATAQLLHARLRRYQAQRARSAEDRLAAKLRAQGWREPQPVHPDWLSDRWPVAR